MASPPQTALPKRAALGFFAGVRALFGGIGFVVTHPSSWGWAMVPVLVASLLFGGAFGGAIWLGNRLSERLLWDPGDGTWTLVGLWALRILFYAVGLIVAAVLALSLAQPLSGFALEALARKQERALGGPAWPDQPFFASSVRALRVSLVGLAVGLPILGLLTLVTFLAPPAGVVTVPLKFLVAGLMAAYDFIDYPFSIRGGGVRDRVRFMNENVWAVLGFGCACAGVLLVPGAALLLLPFGVVGATRLVSRSNGVHDGLAKRGG